MGSLAPSKCLVSPPHKGKEGSGRAIREMRHTTPRSVAMSALRFPLVTASLEAHWWSVATYTAAIPAAPTHRHPSSFTRLARWRCNGVTLCARCFIILLCLTYFAVYSSQSVGTGSPMLKTYYSLGDCKKEKRVADIRNSLLKLCTGELLPFIFKAHLTQ